jgi:hypothetical protein
MPRELASYQMKNKQNLEKRFPNISHWVNEQGWIEIGSDENSSSMVRVLDEGGLVWEGKSSYKTLDEALQKTEIAIADWLNN